MPGSKNYFHKHKLQFAQIFSRFPHAREILGPRLREDDASLGDVFGISYTFPLQLNPELLYNLQRTIRGL